MNVIKNYYVKFNSSKKIPSKKIVKEAKKNGSISTSNSNLNQVNEKNADEISREYQEIIFNAQKEAKQIIDTAKDSAQKIEEQSFATGHDKGYMQGYEEGFEKGYEEKHQELEEKVKSIEEKRTIYNDMYNQLLYHAEQDILEIVIKLTEKLTKDTYKANPTLLKELIIDSINSYAKKDKVVLRINPNNFDLVENHKGKIIEKVTGLNNFKVIKDNSVNQFECFIETPYGNVSTSLENQLDNVKDNLEEMIKNYQYQSGQDYYEK